MHLHDLRHLVASTAVSAGDSLYVVGKLLGHATSAMTERYGHLAPDAVLDVAARTSAKIAGLLAGSKAPEAPAKAERETMPCGARRGWRRPCCGLRICLAGPSPRRSSPVLNARFWIVQSLGLEAHDYQAEAAALWPAEGFNASAGR